MCPLNSINPKARCPWREVLRREVLFHLTKILPLCPAPILTLSSPGGVLSDLSEAYVPSGPQLTTGWG